MASKKQLIDANDVYSLFDVNGMAGLHVGDIDVIPRVDAVEVVRCKDCVKCEYTKPTAGAPFFTCLKWLHWTNPDDFCSYGERKYNGC